MSSSPDHPAILARGLARSYGAVGAVDGIDLDVSRRSCRPPVRSGSRATICRALIAPPTLWLFPATLAVIAAGAIGAIGLPAGPPCNRQRSGKDAIIPRTMSCRPGSAPRP